MKKLHTLFAVFLLFITTGGLGQNEVIQIWPDDIPNQLKTNEKEVHKKEDILRISNVQHPSLDVFLPAKRNANGQAVVICPGGGYGNLSYDWEGTDIAKWFNARGIAAFVLKYRLPNSKSLVVRHKAPLQDAQRAMRVVRFNAKKWNISENKIGVIGFSAGGHLASTLGTHFKEKTYEVFDSIDSVSTRPDFMMLIYPVITFNDAYVHKGSRNNLLGGVQDKELIHTYSNELHVTSKTPPTFLVHASNDYAVPVMNSILFYNSLQKEKVASELHVYSYGGHGFGLAIGKGRLQSWTNRMAEWLKDFQ